MIESNSYGGRGVLLFCLVCCMKSYRKKVISGLFLVKACVLCLILINLSNLPSFGTLIEAYHALVSLNHGLIFDKI